MFRSSRPDYIETVLIVRCPVEHVTILFRSSRPDYIETKALVFIFVHVRINCSGLPGRTTLRPGSSPYASRSSPRALFRSSRPDYIETVWPNRPDP